MNIEQARKDVDTLDNAQDGSVRYLEAHERLSDFINEVENLLKHNSIKQTPALFKGKK